LFSKDYAGIGIVAYFGKIKARLVLMRWAGASDQAPSKKS